MIRREYDSITDWSREGRARCADERGDEIRALLRFAFESFYEKQELSPFGFRGDDPIGEAVEWSVERFRTADLDPTRCTPTFRLFTEVRFWLAQKVGLQAYRRIMLARAAPQIVDPPDPVTNGDSEPRVAPEVLDDIGSRLVRTLRELNARTCADLVGYWLIGTRRLRSAWFGWRNDGEVQNAAPSKKKHSFHVHDALFRFQCLHAALVAETGASIPVVVVRESMFRRCNNRPPYRRPDDVVAPVLPAGSVTGPRSIGKLRRVGLADLLTELLERLARPAFGMREELECLLLRRSLSATTVHALDLERRPDLLDRMRKLPPLGAIELEDA
jgi:hypothetical protein